MISATSSGSTKKTERFLQFLVDGKAFRDLHRFGEMGVKALSAATPKDTAETAASWKFRTGKNKGFYFIEWFNTNVEGGSSPIAILLQYGHGTGTGGYVPGRDYINPAMRGVFDKISEENWRQVTNA